MPCLAHKPSPSQRSVQAFTLVEILVALAVLTVLTLMVGQLVNSISKTTNRATKAIDADEQARLIFARMSDDFAAIYNRKDVNYYFRSDSGNDSFYFYSQVPGHVSTQDPAGTSESSLSNTSLVGYRVSDSISSRQRVELERLSQSLHWMDVPSQTASSGHASSLVHLPYLIKNAFAQTLASAYNNSSNPPSSSSGPAMWDVIGEQVFRMEVCFFLKDGTFSATPMLKSGTAKSNGSATTAPSVTDDSTAGYSVGSRWYDTSGQVAYLCTDATSGAAAWTSQGLGDVNAVVVTLVLLDGKSRLTATASAIAQMAGQFSDFSGSTAPVGKTWLSNANDTSALASASGLSQQTVSAVRVYERFFYLH